MSNLPYTCFVAFGANLAPKGLTVRETLSEAIGRVKAETCDVTKISDFYLTPAFPAGAGPEFVNGVMEVTTSLSPEAFLAHLSRIELGAGRVRTNRWSARSCDLDLLSFDGVVTPDPQTVQRWIDLPLDAQMRETPEELLLPHPRIQDRAFVLVPLKQIAPDWTHPLSGVHIDQLLAALRADEIAQVRPMGA